MHSLPLIHNQTIGTEKVKTINARDLWEYLEIKKDFSDWIKKQINSLGLEEHFDYIKLHQKGELSRTGQVKIEYKLTIDTAKHIAMASRTAKGKELRNYFIEIEKAFHNHISPRVIGGYKSQLSQRNNKIASLEAQIEELKQMNPFQISEVSPMEYMSSCDSFMNDPVLHNHFLEFLYQANKATNELNIVRHVHPSLDSTHQSMANFLCHMTRRYEKVRGVSKYM